MPDEVLRQADVPARRGAARQPGRHARPVCGWSSTGAWSSRCPGRRTRCGRSRACSCCPSCAARTGQRAHHPHAALRRHGGVAGGRAGRGRGRRSPAGVDLAYLAGSGSSGSASPAPATRRSLDAAGRPAAAALGDAVLGRDDETLPGVVQALLRGRGQTVAVAESLTGGLLGAALSAAARVVGDLPRRPASSTRPTPRPSWRGVPADVLAAHGAVSRADGPGARRGRPGTPRRGLGHRDHRRGRSRTRRRASRSAPCTWPSPAPTARRGAHAAAAGRPRAGPAARRHHGAGPAAALARRAGRSPEPTAVRCRADAASGAAVSADGYGGRTRSSSAGGG